MLPIIGKGNAVWSLIYADDAASSFVAVAEKGKAGLWHVVDNVPVTAREFLTNFARELGAKKPFTVPVWLGKLLAGEYAVNLFTSSVLTSNKKIKEDVGWSPKYSSYKEGIKQIVSEWRSEGGL